MNNQQQNQTTQKSKHSRSLSGYNLYVRHAFKNGEVTDFKTAASHWRELLQETKKLWNEKAKLLPPTQPKLIKPQKNKFNKKDLLKKALELSIMCNETCSICLTNNCNKKLHCNHYYHKECFKQWEEKQCQIRYGKVQCCVCRRTVRKKDLENTSISLPVPTNNTTTRAVNRRSSSPAYSRRLARVTAARAAARAAAAHHWLVPRGALRHGAEEWGAEEWRRNLFG